MKHLFFVLALFVLVGCVDPQTERQQAIARQHEADSNAVVAQSNAAIASSKAETERFQILASAAKPDYTPLIALVLVIGVCVVTFIYWAGRTQVAQAETMRAALTQRQVKQVPGPVQAYAARLGGFAEWDGERWLIVDEQGNTLARQKLLTG